MSWGYDYQGAPESFERLIEVDADDLKFLLDHPAIAMHNPCNHHWVGCGDTKDVAARLSATMAAEGSASAPPEMAAAPPSEAPVQRRRVSPYVNVGDEMTWPHPSDPNHTEWALRYGTPTREDLMYAASVIAAYKQLVSDTWEKRRRVLPVLKAAQQTYIPED